MFYTLVLTCTNGRQQLPEISSMVSSLFSAQVQTLNKELDHHVYERLKLL